MKFVVNRDVFSDAVSFVVKLLPQRPTLPILSGVVLEAHDGSLRLSSFDYETSSRTNVEAEIGEPGAVLVQGRLLSEIANRLPQAPVEVNRDDRGVVIRCGQASFHLPVMPLEEFPALPPVEGAQGTIDSEAFSQAVAQVAVAASKEDVAPVITGVNLSLGADSLGLIATDRYRVAVRELDWQGGFDESAAALVPSRTLAEVGKSLSGASRLTLTHVVQGERELIAFTGDHKTVTSLLIKGNFPAVERLFPTELPHYAVIQTSELVDAVRRVQLVLEREAALRFTFTQDGLELEALGTEQAQASEQLDVVLHGDDIVVSLKPQFLLDGVLAIHSEFVRIAFTNTDNPGKPGPVLMTGHTSGDQANDSYRYLLQPNLLMR